MAITTTYVPLANYTVSGSSTTYIDFSSFSGYTDLVLKGTFDVSTTTAVRVRFNSDTGNNYAQTELYANGSSPASGGGTSQTGIYLGDVRAGQVNTILVNINDYARSIRYKKTLSTSGNQNYMEKIVGLWDNGTSSSITTFRIYCESGYFVAGGKFTLYGINSLSNASANKATGGTITAGSGYTYHAFTSGGTFTPNQDITADILLIAGGGGGGTYSGGGGGGGAGGVLLLANQSLTSGTGYTVSVGGGGAANTSGQNSYFGALTQAVGGGYGGSASAGGNGGSGGGASDTGYAAGTGTAGQGFNGGIGTGAGASPGGGGGGAAQAGQDAYGAAVPNIAGYGGSGTNVYYDWAAVTSTGVSGYYAGGGGGGVYINSAFANNGGGAGGNGGGGSGSASSKNATANTGSGGGGGSYTSSPVAPGNGGSGLVIVRYAN